MEQCCRMLRSKNASNVLMDINEHGAPVSQSVDSPIPLTSIANPYWLYTPAPLMAFTVESESFTSSTSMLNMESKKSLEYFLSFGFWINWIFLSLFLSFRLQIFAKCPTRPQEWQVLVLNLQLFELWFFQPQWVQGLFAFPLLPLLWYDPFVPLLLLLLLCLPRCLM